MLSAVVLALALVSAGVAQDLPTDPLDEQAMHASGQNICAFDNGTRVPGALLPNGFFGPEPCVFTSGMVLRGNDTLGGKGAGAGALVWGFAGAGAVVSCTVDTSYVVSTVADKAGRWELVLQQKGGPAAHTLVFATSSAGAEDGADTTVTLTNVLFGAVFLCSGQSNMDFSVAPWGGGGCLEANATVAAAASGKFDDIRLKHSTGAWFNSSAPGMNKQGVMQPGYAVGSYSAVCYLTAMQIKKNIPGYADLPIGLMQASVGGTVIEEWMSTSALEVCLPANESVSHAKCAAGSQENSELYYKMVDPLAPSSLTGALWYQGESNVAQNWHPTNASWPFNDYYACLAKSKVQSWRKAFRSPDMFYGFVSLAAYGGPSGDAAGGASRTNSGLPRMRLDQNSVLTLPNTGVSLALDLGDNGQVPWTPKSARHGGIHPRNKTEVARRMALAFAATGLDLPGVVATGPVFTSATALAATAEAGEEVSATAATATATSSASNTGSIVTVAFSNVDGGLQMSPTAQCCLATQERHAPSPNCSMPLQAVCCPEVPRANNSDSGVPFEVLDAHTNEYVLAARTTVSSDGQSVILAVPTGIKAVGVRYCEQGYPQCVLRNGAGLPAMPFEANVTTTSSEMRL